MMEAAVAILTRWLIEDAIEYEECLTLLMAEGLTSDIAWKWMDWCNYRDIDKEGIAKCLERHISEEDKEDDDLIDMGVYGKMVYKAWYMDAIMDDNS